MAYMGYPYAVPLSPTPPIPKPSPPVVEKEDDDDDDEVELTAKTKEEIEQEELEKEKVLESLKQLEEEHFFFFEVVVDSIEMITEESQKSEEEEVPPLKVSIKFEVLPDMVITQEDFTEELRSSQEMVTGKVVYERDSKPAEDEVEQDKESQWNTKCGISCLFPMSPMTLIKSFQRNSLEVMLYRSNNEEINPSAVIGRTDFLLEDEFCRCVLQAGKIQFAANLPKSLIKQDIYTLTNFRNEETAKISLMIRLACFGSVIITRCERRESSNTYIFKNSPIIETFKCQQYLFQKCSSMSTSDLIKDNKDKSNYTKKQLEFICPEPSELKLCSCVCKCPETSQNQEKTRKLCPIQK